MKKRTAIWVLGGTITSAAKVLGCSKQAVSKWQTDQHGNLTSQQVIDRVLAALARDRYQRALAKLDAVVMDEDTLHDLMQRPPPEVATA